MKDDKSYMGAVIKYIDFHALHKSKDFIKSLSDIYTHLFCEFLKTFPVNQCIKLYSDGDISAKADEMLKNAVLKAIVADKSGPGVHLSDDPNNAIFRSVFDERFSLKTCSEAVYNWMARQNGRVRIGKWPNGKPTRFTYLTPKAELSAVNQVKIPQNAIKQIMQLLNNRMHSIGLSFDPSGPYASSHFEKLCNNTIESRFFGVNPTIEFDSLPKQLQHSSGSTVLNSATCNPEWGQRIALYFLDKLAEATQQASRTSPGIGGGTYYHHCCHDNSGNATIIEAGSGGLFDILQRIEQKKQQIQPLLTEHTKQHKLRVKSLLSTLLPADKKSVGLHVSEQLMDALLNGACLGASKGFAQYAEKVCQHYRFNKIPTAFIVGLTQLASYTASYALICGTATLNPLFLIGMFIPVEKLIANQLNLRDRGKLLLQAPFLALVLFHPENLASPASFILGILKIAFSLGISLVTENITGKITGGIGNRLFDFNPSKTIANSNSTPQQGNTRPSGTTAAALQRSRTSTASAITYRRNITSATQQITPIVQSTTSPPRQQYQGHQTTTTPPECRACQIS